MRKLACVVLALLALNVGMTPTRASSHREAPLISQDPLADNTDVYAFVSPERPDYVVLISNFIPLQFPSSGPNFWKFDDNVLYEIMVDNTGDAVEDITYQFRFTTQVRNTNTFLYNTGPVTTLDDTDLNVRQFVTVTRVNGRRRTGTSTVLASSLPVMPANVGASSMPNYAGIGTGVQRIGSADVRVFAGPRDEGFYVDLGATFDLLQLRPLVNGLGAPIDGLAGFNVHSIAIEVPITALTRTGGRPSGQADPNATVGVWSTASRMATTMRTGAGQAHTGDWVQVSRLGNPLVNEAVLPLALKDAFNGLDPTGDAAALNFVTTPLLPPLMQALFGVQTPATPRNDLVTIFLTGIPGLNQIGTSPRASEMLRLNTGIPPTSRPHRLGVLAGDAAGFPNGRRVGDDVVDVALQAMAGATPLTPDFVRSPNNRLGDGVEQNDKVPLGVPVPGPAESRTRQQRTPTPMKISMTPWVPVLLAVVSGVVAAAVVRPRTVAAPTPPIPRVQGTLPAQLDATLEIVNARLAADPGDAPAAIRAAEILLRKARIERRGGPSMQAELILDTLLEHEPGEYSALRMLGAVYLSQHRFHEAIAVARRALAVKPHDAWQYGVLGDAYLELGDRTRAFEAFDTMMGLRPDAGSYARVAYALELQGDLAESLRVMTMATEATSPADAEALAWQHAHLGNLRLKLGDHEAAAREFRHALYVFPGHPDAVDGLAMVDATTARP